MIEINPALSIDESEIQLDFVRSSGPGGQNINKVTTAAQLRFDLNNAHLPEDVKTRLASIAHNRITSDGYLLIEAKRFRTQEQNRADAIARLVALIQKAGEPIKPRKHTRPTFASKQKRLEEKRRRSEIKSLRRVPPGE